MQIKNDLKAIQIYDKNQLENHFSENDYHTFVGSFLKSMVLAQKCVFKDFVVNIEHMFKICNSLFIL